MAIEVIGHSCHADDVTVVDLWGWIRRPYNSSRARLT